MNDRLKTASMVSALFGILEPNNLKSQNHWRKRFYKTACPELNFPEDWDSLPEKEKERRLNKVQDFGLGINRTEKKQNHKKQ